MRQCYRGSINDIMRIRNLCIALPRANALRCKAFMLRIEVISAMFYGLSELLQVRGNASATLTYPCSARER
jgi:hypothetical protein